VHFACSPNVSLWHKEDIQLFLVCVDVVNEIYVSRRWIQKLYGRIIGRLNTFHNHEETRTEIDKEA